MPKIGTQVKSKDVVKPPRRKTMHASYEEPKTFASNPRRKSRRKSNAQPSKATPGGTFSIFTPT